MKRIYRFAALLLFSVISSVSAFADWTLPVPKASALTTTDSVYIYNVGTSKFVNQGQAWGTQVIVADGEGIGYLVEPLDSGRYSIGSKTDGSTGAKYNTKRTDGFYWFVNGGGTMYGDGWVGGGQKGEFIITSQGNNLYTISVPDASDGQVCGVQNDHANDYGTYNPNWGIFPDITYAGNEANCQFEFISRADYAVWKADYARYEAAQSLKSYLDRASALGVDVSAEQAVYDNTGSTLEQLNNAISSLEDKIANAATWDDPQDVTGKYIVNPTPTVNGDGWTWSKTGGLTYDKGANVAEFWNSAAGTKFEQTISQLPAGVYQLSVQAFTRTGMTSKLFVNQDSVQLAQYADNVVNSRGQANTMFNNGESWDSIFFFTAEPSDVNIGIAVDSTNGDHWTVWRGFVLKSFGTSLESFKHLAGNYAPNWEDTYGSEIFCQQYYDAVASAISSADDATTVEAAIAAYNNTKKAIEDLKTNIALLKKLNQLQSDLDAKNASDYGNDEALQAAIDEAADMYNNLEASNEEIQAMIDKMLAAEQNAINNNVKPGSDITSGKINNPTFSESETGKEAQEDGTYYKVSSKGWTVKGGQENQDGVIGGASDGVAEIWAGNGTVKQQIALKKGAYELKLKNWYRTVQNRNDAYRYFVTKSDSDAICAVVYGAGNRAPFKNIFINKFTEDQKGTFTSASGFLKTGYEGDTIWMPNSRANAKELFNSPNYGQSYYTSSKFVATGLQDSVTIGIEIRHALPYSWAVWDNFELIYTGSDVPSLTAAIKETAQNNADLAGKAMSADAKNQLTAAISAANTAATEDAIYDAAKAMAAAVPVAEASEDKYIDLAAALDKLNDAIENYTKGSQASKDAAAALKTKIETALTDGSIKDADVDKTIKDVETAITNLRKPDYSSATMATPVEMTSMITNPKFDADGTGSHAQATGWTKVGSTSDFVVNNIAQTWNSDGDISQVVKGLPKGLYQLVAQGFYEDGSFDADTAAYYADTLKVRTKLFAGKDSVNLKPFIWIPTDEVNQNLLTNAPSTTGAWKEFTDKKTNTTYYFPNDREQVKLRFDNVVDVNSTDLNHDGDNADPAWLNSVYTYVDSDTLKIGFKTINHGKTDWACVTNFQLFYFGDGEDTKDVANTTGINDVNAAKTVARRIYTVDGREIDALQKGVNIIKMTDVNGKTTVKKVIVR